jgi:hypothetical protein
MVRDKKKYDREYARKNKEQNYQRWLKWTQANKERRREIARLSYHRRKLAKQAEAEKTP